MTGSLQHGEQADVETRAMTGNQPPSADGDVVAGDTSQGSADHPVPEKSLTRRHAGKALAFTFGAVAGFAGKTVDEFITPQDAADQIRRDIGSISPLNVLAIPEHYPETQGYTYILPKPVQGPANKLPYPLSVGPDQYSNWIRRNGGVDVSFTYIRLIVENGWSNQVSLTAIEARVKHLPSLRGTLLYVPPQAADISINFGFDLDEAGPSAAEIADGMNPVDAVQNSTFPRNYVTNHPYLLSHTVTIAPREVVPLVVFAATAKNYCEFAIRITGTIDQRPFTQIFNNNGMPFRVTAPSTSAFWSKNFSLSNSGYEATYDGSDLQGWKAVSNRRK